MSKKMLMSCPPYRQSGAVLVVALVILAAITVIGVSNMKSTTMEMKMATSSMKRAKQFAFAEKALLHAEESLVSRVISINQLFSDGCGANCFDADCDNGLCFDGEYTSDMVFRSECQVGTDSATTGDARKAYWRDEAIWNDGTKHEELTIAHTENGTAVTRNAKYIAEFLCFVKGGDTDFGVDPKNNNGVPIFRVTVYVENDASQDNSVPIMLQSNYILNI